MPSINFVLGGKQYGLSRKQVVDNISGEEPRLIKRYYVEVDGRRYPPKQLVETATGLRPVEFTTMDAVRILKKLCFEIGSER